MDYRNFSKSKYWANVLGGVMCYVMAAYEIYYGITNHTNLYGALVFLFLALNCTFRVFSYYKLKRIKNSVEDESLITRAERRQNIIITLFSNATAIICLLAFVALTIARKGSTALILFLVACAICFCLILAQTIRNLRRFDRLNK